MRKQLLLNGLMTSCTAQKFPFGSSLGSDSWWIPLMSLGTVHFLLLWGWDEVCSYAQTCFSLSLAKCKIFSMPLKQFVFTKLCYVSSATDVFLWNCLVTDTLCSKNWKVTLKEVEVYWVYQTYGENVTFLSSWSGRAGMKMESIASLRSTDFSKCTGA